MADDRRQLPSQPLQTQAQLQPHHPQKQQQTQQQAQQQQVQQQQQAALSSARLQHFNYLTPSSQVSAQASVQAPQQQQQQHYLGLSAPERRHYSFDTDRDSRRFSMSTTLTMDYDQTEGLGGLSVSSYESIDDDRSEPAIRGYHFSSKLKFILYSFLYSLCMYNFCCFYLSTLICIVVCCVSGSAAGYDFALGCPFRVPLPCAPSAQPRWSSCPV